MNRVEYDEICDEYDLLCTRLKRKPLITWQSVRRVVDNLPAKTSMQERRRRIDALEEKQRADVEAFKSNLRHRP